MIGKKNPVNHPRMFNVGKIYKVDMAIFSSDCDTMTGEGASQRRGLRNEQMRKTV